MAIVQRDKAGQTHQRDDCAKSDHDPGPYLYKLNEHAC